MIPARVVLLDRDGVINIDSENFIKTPAEWQPIAGSLAAIAQLNRLGFSVVVITNQSGIGRGLFTETALQAMHAKMQTLLAEQGGQIARIYYCPHAPEIQCTCRKPKPGLVEQFSRDTGISPKELFLVGDSWRDIQTALVVGARPVLVKTGKGLATLAAHPDLSCPVFTDLSAAAQYIIEVYTKP